MNEQSNPNDIIPPVVHPKTRGLSNRAFSRAVSLFTSRNARNRRIAVIVVLCLAFALTVAVLPFLSARGPTARVYAATLQITNLGTALGAFKTDNGYFPRGAKGLICLMQKPPDATNWHGPYMVHAVPTDPWGHAYIYECPGRHNPQTYDLSSISPDGQEISNWK
jgi:general secretion pathway protein G